MAEKWSQSDHYFIFAGNNAERVNAVGIMISSKCRKCLKGFKPISERIIIYGQLEGVVLSNTPKSDIVIILGNFNAKIGNSNNGMLTIMGRHSE